MSYAFILFGLIPIYSQDLAFPGAEGYGRFANGWKGGQVLVVSNLNDSGPGSFREALEYTGPSIIVFDVSGTIELNSILQERNGNVYIAGQTSKNGITLKNYELRISGSNSVVRHIKSRAGESTGKKVHAFQIYANSGSIQNIILDHLTATGGIDECIAVIGQPQGSTTVRNVTVSNSIIGPGFQGHGFGLFIKYKVDMVSVLRNLFYGNIQRNPQWNGATGELINNTIANWRGLGATFKEDEDTGKNCEVDVIGNYAWAGSGSKAALGYYMPENTGQRLYLEENFHSNYRTNPYDNNETDIFDSGELSKYGHDNLAFVSNSKFANTNASIMDVYEGRDWVCDYAGTMFRDALDNKTVNNIKSGISEFYDSQAEFGPIPNVPNESRGIDWLSLSNQQLEDKLAELAGDIPGAPPTNTSPSISNISNQTIDQDQTMGPVDFTVSDAESPAGTLTVTASSGNTNLVKQSGIDLGGSGSNREITITPEAGMSGSAVITVNVTDGDGGSDSETFTLNVDAVSSNTPPTISNISNQQVDQDNTLGPISFTIDDDESSPGSLTVTANSSNKSLLPNSGITLGGNGGNRNITLTPASGQSGTTTITVTVDDGDDTDSDSFTLTVNPVSSNTPPTISNISNQQVDQDNTLGPISFTIDDDESSPGSLTVTANSSNKSLLPNSGITLGGNGGNRNITLTPASGQSGTTTITVTVNDGDDTDSDSFTLTVNPVSSNTPPTISNISNQQVDQDNTLGPISFTIDDDESSPGSLTVTANSSNKSLLPNSGITLGGNGGNRNITLTPASGQSGTTTITVTVDDGDDTDSDSFTLTVNPVSSNTPPTISNISNQQVDQDNTLGPISFTIDDNESATADLTVTANSSNKTLLPNSGITLGGNGSNRNFTLTPASGQSGNTTITIRVSDGEDSETESFVLNVNNAANQPPTISNISDQSIDENSSVGPLDFTVSDAESAANSLTVTASSSNTSLIAEAGLELGGTGSNRSITVTPEAGQTGSAVITVSVEDSDGGSDSESFTVTVNAVSSNTPPTISNISNQQVDQDNTLGPISFTVDDNESASGSLTVTATSSNTTLLPNSAITLGGGGSNRNITMTPASGESGTSTITLTVSDGESSDQETFLLTVNAVTNQAPVIGEIANQTIQQDQTMGPIDFTVDDAETAANSLKLSATCTNEDLIRASQILLGGSGSNRTITITPETGSWGTAEVTVTVTDESGDSDSETFTLNVLAAPNTAPRISNISNQEVDEGNTAGPISFTVSDEESNASDLTVSANSSNKTLLPIGNISLTGTGSNREISLTPVNGQSGSTTVTVTVIDEQGDSDSESFVLTVNGTANEAPVISNIPNHTIEQDGSTGTIFFNVSDQETSSSELTIVAVSSNTDLVESSGIVLGTFTQNIRTITVTPVEGKHGITTITITVSDGNGGSDVETFSVTVTESVNEAPSISVISNQTIDQGTALGPLSFTVSDPEDAADDLQISATSDNEGLVADHQITILGNGSSRDLYVSPNISAFGTATVTITVTDNNDNSTSESFVLTVVEEVTDVQMSFTLTISDANCGNDDGSIDLTVNGGVEPYTYNWSNGATTASISNLSAGTYTLTVTDAADNSRTASFNVGSIAGEGSFAIEGIVTNATCEQNDGVVSLDMEGDYTYEWSNGSDAAEISGLEPGTYEVTVTNEMGCYVTESFTIQNEQGPAKPEITVVDETLSSSVASEYQWYFNGNSIPGATNQEFKATESGNYSVLVRDGNGCTAVSDEIPLEVIDPTIDSNALSLQYYPNPVQNEITIEVSAAEEIERLKLGVFTLDGRPVATRKLPSVNSKEVNEQFDLSGLEPGVYLLKIKMDGEVVVRRIFKN